MALDLAATAIPSQRDPASTRQAEPHAGATAQADSGQATSRLAPLEQADGKRGEQSGLEQHEAQNQARGSDPDARGRIVDLRA